MVDPNSIASLYPPPPAPPVNALSSLSLPQIVSLAQGVTQLQGSQADLASRRATGQAFQGALNDDGSIDQAKLSTALQNNPAAAYGMPDTTAKMLAQRGGQMDLDTKQNQFVVDATTPS